MLKRFLLFANITYYAHGGWNDFIDSFDTIDAATKHALGYVDRRNLDWWHVVDITTGQKVAISSGAYGSVDEDMPTFAPPTDCDTLGRPPTFEERHAANDEALEEIRKFVYGS